MAPAETFRAADGRTATTARVDRLWVLERLGRGEVDCGGELIQTGAALRLLDAGPHQPPQALIFDDGSAVDLYLESWVDVDNCVEAVGRWKGVAGTFDGRSGTYRRTDDLVQVEVVLTDSAPVATAAPATTIAPAATVASYPISTAVVSEADTAAEAAAFEPVNRAYDLYNLGNIGEWVEVRDLGSVWPSEEQRTQGMEEWRSEERVRYQAGFRYVATECVSNGLGDWPGVSDDGAVTGYYFKCESVWTRHYENLGEFGVYESFNWVVKDGAVLAVNSERRLIKQTAPRIT